MNQLAQRAFVGTIRIHRVEPREPQPAQRATAAFIQREVVQERSPARDAEEFRVERLRIAQAPRAYRNPGNFAQSFAADAALIGKNQGESQLGKAAKSPPRGAEHTYQALTASCL